MANGWKGNVSARYRWNQDTQKNIIALGGWALPYLHKKEIKLWNMDNLGIAGIIFSGILL